MPETKKKETVMDALLTFRLASEQGFRAGVADILHMEGWDLKRGVQRASNREKSEREMAAELKQRIAERELKKATLAAALSKARDPQTGIRPQIMRMAALMEAIEVGSETIDTTRRKLEVDELDSLGLTDLFYEAAVEVREALDDGSLDAVRRSAAVIALLATAASEYAEKL